MRTPSKRTSITASVAALAGVGALALSSTSMATGQMAAAPDSPTLTRAELDPLNNGGGSGKSTVTVDGRTLDVSVDARGLLKGMPHAQHIHFGAQARNECPTVRDDDNADHRLNTAEGQPAYGPVRVSLTNKGDTSAKSTLAVDRFPAAGKGHVHYDRDGIRTSRQVARGIRRGDAVVVIHGIDYNGNGKYDFAAGRSELDPALPAEATDPVLCGVLEVAPGGSTGEPTATATPTDEPSESDTPILPIP